MSVEAMIDQGAFEKFFDGIGGDADFFRELVDSYLASSPGLIASMQQAIAAGDAPLLQRTAHSLKSGSASFGLLSFAAQCKQLEDIGKSGQLAGAEEKFQSLQAAYTAVTAALQAQVQRTRLAYT